MILIMFESQKDAGKRKKDKVEENQTRGPADQKTRRPANSRYPLFSD